MKRITVTLTEDQARWILRALESYKNSFGWDNTLDAFTRRIEAKLAKAKS